MHGLHASDQLSIRVADLGLLDAMMNRLRVSPPESFGGSAVDVATDLAEGSDEPAAHRRPAVPDPGLSRVIIRPSGTEPKLKCYLEVIRSVGSAAELPEARQAGPRRPRRRPRGRPRGARTLTPGTCVAAGLEFDLDAAVHDPGGESVRAGAPDCQGIRRFRRS